MSKSKYILSFEFRLEVSKKNGLTKYFIKKSESSKSYQINKTISELIANFTEAKPLKQGISEIHPNADLSDEKIYHSYYDLFYSMLKIGVLKKANQKNIKFKPRFISNQKFYNYKIIKIISTNSKVEVYEALLNGKKFIIKSLRKKSLSKKKKEKYSKLLNSEISKIQALNHHSIYKLVQFYSKSDLAVLEYIDGVSIEDFIKKSRRANSVKINIINEIITCFGYLHHKQIIHGDIHLNNFMVTSEKKLKLIDFGYALTTSEDKGIHGGIPQYMSPERVKNHSYSFSKQIGNPASEVFQLAIIIYFIIYEKYPFQGYLWKDVSNEILNKEISSINFKKAPFLSFNQEKIILKCFEKNPNNRFKNATHLKKAWDKV